MIAENAARLRGFLGRAGSSYAPGLDEVPNALVAPATGQFRPRDARRQAVHAEIAALPLRAQEVFDGGVYDAEGRIVVSAIHLGGGRRHLPGLAPPSAAGALDLPGTWLYGGVLHQHFGHFLTESLGRLWAWPRQRPAPEGVLWLLPGPVPARRAAQMAKAVERPFIVQLLRQLRVRGAQRVVTETLRVERLLVPAQLMMNAGGRSVAGHPVFRRFGHGLAAGAPEVQPGRHLYVSRAGLARGGRFVLEEEVERRLAAAGWDILRPETLDIAGQVAAYAAAERLLFAEGSALHLYAMVARPEQRVGVICRRTPAKRKFEAQLRGFGAGEVHTLDAVRALVLPMRRGADGRPRPVGRNDAEAVLDFALLGRMLEEHGFLPDGLWTPPDPAQVDAAVAAALAARRAAEPDTEFALIPRAEAPRGPADDD